MYNRNDDNTSKSAILTTLWNKGMPHLQRMPNAKGTLLIRRQLLVRFPYQSTSRSEQEADHEGQMALGRKREVSTASFKQAAVTFLPSFLQSKQTKPRLKHILKPGSCMFNVVVSRTGNVEKAGTSNRNTSQKAKTRIII
jgi:hypothetical protein